MQNSKSLFIRPSRAGKSVIETLSGVINALTSNLGRLLQRFTSVPFWRGFGYLRVEAHGGLYILCATPEYVSDELGQFHFEQLAICHEDIPRAHCRYLTRWYYYVFRKASVGA